MTPASLTAVARHLSFIRETQGPNRGAWVEFLQRFSHGVPGDSWCADFVSFCEDVAYHGKPPLARSGSTIVKLDDARAKGFIVAQPVVDDLFFFVNGAGTPHHVGIVTGIAPLMGIAGNTSAGGTSSNGTGVFEHALNGDPASIVFVHLPKGIAP